MRLIGYIRVSTTGQVKDGLGLPTQERLVRRWAKREGHTLVRIMRENGRSGTLPVEERPGLIEVLDAVRTGKADGIVVSDLTRLGRTLTVQEAALGKCWALEGRVFAVDGGEVAEDDPDDPVRTAMRQMAGVFAQLDRAMIVKRLRNGRETKAAKGEYAGGGVPYGSEYANSDELRVVDRVVELRRAGASFRQICDALDADGHQPRRAPRFSPMTVRAIARRHGLT
jgi:DNA invertase Pin-like site-specific DNA recombinase